MKHVYDPKMPPGKNTLIRGGGTDTPTGETVMNMASCEMGIEPTKSQGEHACKTILDIGNSIRDYMHVMDRESQRDKRALASTLDVLRACLTKFRELEADEVHMEFRESYQQFSEDLEKVLKAVSQRLGVKEIEPS